MREKAIVVARLAGSASFDDFAPDSTLRLAVERAIEIIGEAASHVTADMRASHPEILWRDIVGQRNVLAHDYGQIDPVRLWYAATHDMVPLIESIDAIIPRQQ